MEGKKYPKRNLIQVCLRYIAGSREHIKNCVIKLKFERPESLLNCYFTGTRAKLLVKNFMNHNSSIILHFIYVYITYVYLKSKHILCIHVNTNKFKV